MIQSRLFLVSPKVAEQIRQCGPDQLRNVVCRACSTAVQLTGLTDERVTTALGLICDGRGDDTLAGEMSGLVQELDNDAWDLQDKVEIGEAEQADCVRAFAKARAAASVAFAIRRTDVSAVESLYESFHAINDFATFTRVVEAALGGF